MVYADTRAVPRALLCQEAHRLHRRGGGRQPHVRHLQWLSGISAQLLSECETTLGQYITRADIQKNHPALVAISTLWKDCVNFDPDFAKWAAEN